MIEDLCNVKSLVFYGFIGTYKLIGIPALFVPVRIGCRFLTCDGPKLLITCFRISSKRRFEPCFCVSTVQNTRKGTGTGPFCSSSYHYSYISTRMGTGWIHRLQFPGTKRIPLWSIDLQLKDSTWNTVHVASAQPDLSKSQRISLRFERDDNGLHRFFFSFQKDGVCWDGCPIQSNRTTPPTRHRRKTRSDTSRNTTPRQPSSHASGAPSFYTRNARGTSAATFGRGACTRWERNVSCEAVRLEIGRDASVTTWNEIQETKGKKPRINLGKERNSPLSCLVMSCWEG